MSVILDALKKYLEGYIKEFENMNLCSNNNIHSVKCYEYFQTEKLFTIVMELCDKNLSKLLTEKINNTKNAFSVNEIYDIMRQLNTTFKIMKENKIIHRDLKLENVLIKYNNDNSGNYTVKLADYGCSKRLNSLSRNYCLSNAGTLIYMAPEILNQKQYNYKCDLWSLGIIIYRLKFVNSPILGATEQALINSLRYFDNKKLKSTGNKDLDDLISHLLVKEPNDRYGWEEYLNHPFFKSKSIYDNNILNVQNSIQCFPSPSLIGLKKTGGLNCMNAILQCFCHIYKFLEFFMFKYNQPIYNIINNNKSKLSYSFNILINNLMAENYDNSNLIKFYEPREFKDKIEMMNPIFRDKGADHPKNLLNFIILTLHEELNKAKKNEEINNYYYLNQTNSNLMFEYYAKNFVKQNQSLISDLFYGANCNINRCLYCNITVYDYQTYFFIVFPLEEVKKFKNEKFNNQFNNFNFYNSFNFNLNNEVNIYDCFDYYEKVNVMPGSMFCNYCKKTTSYAMGTRLTIGAEILILRFNRRKGTEISDVKINFEEFLNLSNYIEYKNIGVNYKLIGVITFIGGNDMNGNYIAFCNDPINLLWYKYEDDIVTQVKNFENEIINYGMPYVLFYQKTF